MHDPKIDPITKGERQQAANKGPEENEPLPEGPRAGMLKRKLQANQLLDSMAANKDASGRDNGGVGVRVEQ